MKREMDFENFHVYEGNKVAYLAARKIVEFPGELFNPLYVHGGTGLGKTHLLWAIYLELNKKTDAQFFSVREFEKYLEENKTLDTSIIIDDLHTISDKYHDMILGLIDTALANDKQICFSGNVAPRDMKKFDVKLLSRLEGGLVCDILPPKEIDLVDMIKKKSGEAGIILPDEVSLEIAQISTGSIRAIEGMINRLVAYSSLGNVSLDIDSVRMILKEFYPKGIYSPVSSLLEELKKNASEVLQGVSEKMDVRDEYKEKVYVWEMKGFDTSSLKPLLDGDIEILKKEYDNFIQKVERIIELQKEFGSLDTSNVPGDAMKIESMLFSPDRIEEIEELIVKMKKGMEVVETENSFDSYLVGSCNQKAVDIYKEQVSQNLGSKFNPFIIFGKKGTGKTRFLQAVYVDLKSQNKSVKLSDFADESEMSELGDIEKYDVLIFDNFHNIFSAAEDVRKNVFDCISTFLKSNKAVVFSSDIFPSDLSLSGDEKSIFEFGIETELGEPNPEVVKAYIKSKLAQDKAEEIIMKSLPHFTSFYVIDEFMVSLEIPKPAEVVALGFPGEGIEKEMSEKEEAEVVSLGLPGEELEQEKEEPEEKEKAEVISLGFPGEEPEKEVAVSKEDEEREIAAAEKEEEHREEVSRPADKVEPLKTVKEDRFLLQEISGELIEDNY